MLVVGGDDVAQHQPAGGTILSNVDQPRASTFQQFSGSRDAARRNFGFKPSVDAAWLRTARANRILETRNRRKKKLGDRFVFYGGEDNGA